MAQPGQVPQPPKLQKGIEATEVQYIDDVGEAAMAKHPQVPQAPELRKGVEAPETQYIDKFAEDCRFFFWKQVGTKAQKMTDRMEDIGNLNLYALHHA